MTTSPIRVAVLAAFAWLVGCGSVATASDIPVYGYTVVRTYPHDPKAFTEGLFYDGGFLYESTGEYMGSGVRKVRLDTGEVAQHLDTPPGYFGEGIIVSGDHLLQLTWRDGVGFIYDRKTFAPVGKFSYPGEGWAMTRDAKHLYMSDGTPTIRVLDPVTLAQTGRIDVTADGVPLRMINELEWVKGEILANVWQTERIARIDPKTGRVTGWIDLSGLVDTSRMDDPADDVLNGIAYDAAHDRLFVTGKRWPALFEIRLKPKRSR
ncbi:glutaminyl-peptide cyclotransferase [Dyella sp. 333MFSha]|uniref:glutaminyl-peptide cyclotransferase n=1 Tax=Dyella sp. 333MFSha TaxID=1798240 RepID=UPI00087F8BB4|nr:glutaminyl-peptide cyclotransferase [Dyella sp. 333MFSha]SDG20536.1 Glutamine cyclotransferase [Dyella sp. 333MFSha]